VLLLASSIGIGVEKVQNHKVKQVVLLLKRWYLQWQNMALWKAKQVVLL
jgi:hypothetical protein